MTLGHQWHERYLRSDRYLQLRASEISTVKVDITWGIFCPRRYDYQYLEVHPGVYLCLNHLLGGVAHHSWLLQDMHFERIFQSLLYLGVPSTTVAVFRNLETWFWVETHLPKISKFILFAVQASFGRWRWAKFIGWKRRQTLGDYIS